MSVSVGFRADETPPLDSVEPLATELTADHGLVTLLTTLRAARSDLTVPAHFAPPPNPVCLTLGPDEAPVGATAVHHHLGDGTRSEAWARLRALMKHSGDNP